MNAAVPLKKIPVLKLVLVIRNTSNQEIANYLSTPDKKVFREQVSLWVNGREPGPTREQAEKIAEFLKWNLEEIWDEANTTVTAKPSRKKKIGPAKLVDESALKVSESHLRILPAPDYSLAEQWLDPIRDVSEADERVSIPVWAQDIAASPLDSLDATDAELVWVPSLMRKLYGAKLWAVRIVGRSMVKAGINPGDILFVRRSSSAKDGDIVVAAQDGGVTLKRKRGAQLVPESDEHAVIDMVEDCRLLGVAHSIYKPAK